MPYGIKKVRNGWKVYNKDTGKTYSKKPFKSKKAAERQLRALQANTKD